MFVPQRTPPFVREAACRKSGVDEAVSSSAKIVRNGEVTPTAQRCRGYRPDAKGTRSRARAALTDHGMDAAEPGGAYGGVHAECAGLERARVLPGRARHH